MARNQWEFWPIQEVKPWVGPGCPPGSLTIYWGDCHAVGIGPVPIKVQVGDTLGLYDAIGCHIGKLTIGEYLVFDHTATPPRQLFVGKYGAATSVEKP